MSLNSLASSSIRHSVRKSLGRVPKQQWKNAARHTSTSAETIQEPTNVANTVVIPKRIERGPTDILKALSTTVKKVYSAPHYKYHDDPFLIPTSNVAKRMFALSQESGRKAAHWVRQEHADLFQHKVADPPIEVFVPRAVYDEKSEVDEGALQKVIALHLVSDSLTVYGLLEQKGVELSRDTKQSLLELICYYNGEDPLEEDWIEERWFKQGARRKETRMNMWKNGGSAEKLFQKLSPHDSGAYSALICGKAEFGDMDGAYKLYQEAMDAGIYLPTVVFNKLIKGGSVLKEGHELRWQFVEEIMATMKQQGVSPDLDTLNAILETISYMSVNKSSQKNSLEILAEFRALGIEPSAASYYFLLRIFCTDRGSVRSGILEDILNILQGKSLDIRDPRDVMFFTEAMDLCRYYLSDIDLAYRVNKLLHTADNYNMIGDSYKESVYYRNFFALVLQMGSLTEFMALYDKLVPNVYVPELGIMEEIIKTVSMNDASELLPRLWSDLVMFEMSEAESILCTMLTALQRSHSTDKSLLDKHADVAWAIWGKVENQKADRTRKRIEWTGPMLGDIVEVVLRADRYNMALQVMNCLDKRQQEVLGVPRIESLAAFLDKAIELKDIKNAIWCIQYCSDAGFLDTTRLAQKLTNSVELTDLEMSKLVSIVGQNALEKEAATGS